LGKYVSTSKKGFGFAVFVFVRLFVLLLGDHLPYGACARSASGSENRVFPRHHLSS